MPLNRGQFKLISLLAKKFPRQFSGGALNDVGILHSSTGIILCMRPTNESRRYNVTSSLIG